MTNFSRTELHRRYLTVAISFVYIIVCLTSNLDSHVSGDHDVLALEVSVNDVLAVAVSDAGSHSAKDVASLRLRQDAAPVDEVEEVAVLGYFQHEVDLSRSLHHVEDSEDVRVVQSTDDGHLSRQELCQNLLRGVSFLEHLDGDL